MASYNSVTSTPLVLDGRGTWDALLAPPALPCTAAAQGICVCRAGEPQRHGRMAYRLSDFVYVLLSFLCRT